MPVITPVLVSSSCSVYNYAVVSAVNKSDDLAQLQLNYRAYNKVSNDSLAYAVTNNYIKQDSLSQALKMATAVTMLGLKLRNSNYQGNLSWTAIQQYTLSAINPEEYLQKEFLGQVSASIAVRIFCLSLPGVGCR